MVIAAETVIDEITDDQMLTWDEASKVETKRVFVKKYGKYIEYRTFVPMDEMARIQAQYMTTRKDYLGYMVAILKYVMVSPSLTTPESVRAAQKSDSGLLLQIIGDTVNVKEADEIAGGLGED